MKINDTQTIESIISESKVCRLGLTDGTEPYIVPLCFGYRNKALYFHTGRNGKKIDMLLKNNRVCFEMEVGVEVFPADNPCKWNMRYRSVVGSGRALLLKDAAEKKEALDIIVNHYGGKPTPYDEKLVDGLSVIKVLVDSFTGRESKV